MSLLLRVCYERYDDPVKEKKSRDRLVLLGAQLKLQVTTSEQKYGMEYSKFKKDDDDDGGDGGDDQI